MLQTDLIPTITHPTSRIPKTQHPILAECLPKPPPLVQPPAHPESLAPFSFHHHSIVTYTSAQQANPPLSSKTSTSSRYNPYKRPSQKPSKLTTIPLDFPTYTHTPFTAIPSPTTFNHDIDTTLSHPPPHKRKRVSRHDINLDPNSHSHSHSTKTLTHNPEAVHVSYPLSVFDESIITPIPIPIPVPVFRYTSEEESLEVHITRMRAVIKGFEKAFWQI
ncbi:hypothetical protein EG329_000454 [Mollisiaceae sp. DMI_Dod_QoI]|nr:hypothetical protein EG329_000454 [Helotiales sp. DMI_Dod_QoI]